MKTTFILFLFCTLFICAKSLKQKEILSNLANYNGLFKKSDKIYTNGVFKFIEYGPSWHCGPKLIPSHLFEEFLCFYNNGYALHFSTYAYTDSINASYNLQKFPKKWGAYYISGDTINFIAQLEVWDWQPSVAYCFCRAIIKSKDTLIDCKVVPPYPKVRFGYLHINADDTLGKVAVFHTFPAKFLVDSTITYNPQNN
jgi:hypothetical protein